MRLKRAMTKWIPCDGKYAEGDVLRWAEPTWERRRKKWCKKGDRANMAQVVRLGDDFAQLEVMASMGDEPFKPGEVIIRAFRKLQKERAERAAVGDESARSLLVSDHFKPELSALLGTPREAGREHAASSRGPGRGSAGRRGYLRRGKRKIQLKP